MGHRRDRGRDVSRLELDLEGLARCDQITHPRRPAQHLPTGDGRIRTCVLWGSDNPQLPARHRARDRQGVFPQRSATELRRHITGICHERRRGLNPHRRAPSAPLPAIGAAAHLGVLPVELRRHKVGTGFSASPRKLPSQRCCHTRQTASNQGKPGLTTGTTAGLEPAPPRLAVGNPRPSARRRASVGEGVGALPVELRRPCSVKTEGPPHWAARWCTEKGRC